MKKNLAFTLAEVLIVLAILGVVAALTVPDLLSNTKGKEYSTRLKKGISVMNQAVMREEAMNNQNFSDAADAAAAVEVFSDNLRGVETLDSTEIAKTGCTGYAAGVLLADGLVITANAPSGTGSSKTFEACIDVNGITKPNTFTTDSAEPKDTYKLELKGDTVTCKGNLCKAVMSDQTGVTSDS